MKSICLFSNALIAIGAAAFLSACGSTDPCADSKGTCVGLTITSSTVKTVDAISITASGAKTGTKSSPLGGARSFPIFLAVSITDSTTGKLHLEVSGQLAGAVVGTGSIEADIVPGRHIPKTIDIEGLNPLHGDMSTPPGSDLSTGSDMAGSTGSDMAGSTCNGTVCKSGCVDTNTNKDNCGTCEHSCGAGMCESGSCSSFVVANTGATNPTNVNSIASDGTNLYFSDASTIYSCQLSNCNATKQPLVTNDSNALHGGPRAMAISADNAYLYFSTFDLNTSIVYQCATPSCGGLKTVLSVSNNNPIYFTLDSKSVYLSYVAPNNMPVIQSCSTAGPFPCTSPTPLASQSTTELVSDGTSLFWTTSTGISKCTLPGCTGATGIITEAGAGQLRAFGGKLYWINTSGGGASNCTPANCTGTLNNFAKSMIMSPFVLAPDSDYLYIGKRADGKTLGRCAMPDCAGSFDAVGKDTGDATALLVTSTTVYWSVGSVIYGWMK